MPQNTSNFSCNLFSHPHGVTHSFLIMRFRLTGCAAPDNARCNTRPHPSTALPVSHATKSGVSTELFCFYSGVSRPTKRHEECCSPAREKRAAAHRSSPVCPGATPTSGSSQHTQ